MLNIDILYLTINLLLLYIFCRMGWYVTKGLNYSTAASVCVAAFTFVLGSRYLRSHDYAHYIDVFNRRTEADQHLFTWLNDFLAVVGINGYGAFYVYALIFSTCLFFLLRRYQKYAAYIFPIALIALIVFHESMIRQALSFSFVFLFIDQLISIENANNITTKNDNENEYYSESGNMELYPYEPYDTDSLLQTKEDITNSIKGDQSKNWKHIALCALFALCTISVHTANILIIGLILLFWLTTKKMTIPFYISIPLILLSAIVLNKVLKIELIAPYLQLIQGNDAKLDSYIEKSDYWFGEEGASDKYTRSGIILMLELWGYSAMFWLCDKMSKQINLNSTFAISLNSLIIGSIIMITFRELEIINRMGYVLSLLWFIPLSMSLYHIRDFQFKAWEKLLLMGLVWWVYEYIKYLVMRNEGMTLFLWDMSQSL